MGKSGGLTETQLKFIKIKADPGTELKRLTHKDLGDMLGVTKQCISKWSVKPEIKEAIALTKEKDPENIYPNMMKDLEDIAFGRIRGITPFAKLRAMELWFKAGGYLKKPKDGVGEESEKDKSFEKKLMELREKRSRGNINRNL